MEKKSGFTEGAFLLAIAFIVASIILSRGFSTIAKPDRTVTVRGFAEREVEADLAIWPLTFSLGGNDLVELQQTILTDTEIVTKFLESYGLTSDDFTVKAPSITDTSVNPYMDKDSARFTYIAKMVILVRSDRVNEVKSAQLDSLDLMGKGIAVAQDYDSSIQFEFTGLNSIKPEMIAEATEKARIAAEQFATDSGSKVGKIKTATQGLFSIDNAATGLEEKKSIRVVTTVEYILKD